MTSASYKMDASIGQPSPVINSTSISYIVAGGFWHILQGAFVDTDGDGIDDQWEQDHFGDLTTATATSDFDRDGYSDLQEYLNDLVSETDSSGDVYDPKIKNAPWGTGYDHSSVSKILFLVIPAAIGGGR